MHIRTTIIGATIVFLTASAQAQVLQTFSNVVDHNLTYFYGSWEATGSTLGSTNPNSQFLQGAGVYDITGSSTIVPTNSADSKLEFFNASPISIGSNNLLSVTAKTLSGNAASSFLVILVDSGGKTASVSFATSAFSTLNYTTALGALTPQSGFRNDLIESLIISGGQLGGTDRFNVSFDTVSATAIPEPSTYAALVGMACLGAALRQRRKRNKA